MSLLFGLFAAFLANDIWVRNQAAQQAVIEEGDALRNLARLSEGHDEQHRLELRKALVDYAEVVIQKDWPLMTEGKRSLDDVIRKLWSECKGGKPGYVDVRLRELCIEFGGEDLGEIYDLCVMKPGPLPIDQAHAPWGGTLGPDGFSVSNGQALAAWPSKIH